MKSSLLVLILMVSLAVVLASSKSEKKYRMLLWTEQCYDVHFVEFDFFNVDCLKSFISRGLSFGIIAGSSVLKLPQMYNFYKAKSTFGVSSTMLYLDVVSFTPSPIYNIMKVHPFFTYGEQIIVLTENIILILMMWYYDKNNSMGKSFGIVVAYACLVVGFIYAPESMWYTYPLIGAAAATFGRFPQIMDNYNNKHTGTLSAFTFVLNSLGGAARMFTTMNETGDLSIVASQAVGVVGCLVVLAQMFTYRAETRTALQAKAAKQED